MDFFDKLTKKATETYKGAAEKTSKIAKETKLKMKISDNKSRINDIYEEIGKKVYQKHVSNEDVCIKKDLEEECAKIDILSEEIENYHKEILELSDEKVCINCKETMKKEARFCPKCGAEQPEIKDEPEAKEVEILEENDNLENEKVEDENTTEQETNVENENNTEQADIESNTDNNNE